MQVPAPAPLQQENGAPAPVHRVFPVSSLGPPIVIEPGVEPPVPAGQAADVVLLFTVTRQVPTKICESFVACLSLLLSQVRWMASCGLRQSWSSGAPAVLS